MMSLVPQQSLPGHSVVLVKVKDDLFPLHLARQLIMTVTLLDHGFWSPGSLQLTHQLSPQPHIVRWLISSRTFLEPETYMYLTQLDNPNNTQQI